MEYVSKVKEETVLESEVEETEVEGTEEPFEKSTTDAINAYRKIRSALRVSCLASTVTAFSWS